MNSIIISDLHIGSPFFFSEAFERFIREIPESHELVLNGDIIDNPYTKLNPSLQRILDLIKQFSFRQKVVWVRGNHDNGYLPDQFGKVQFKRLHTVEHRLLITHGDDFDDIMPKNRLFMKAFKLMHNLRIKLGAKPVHVAQYAKKWDYFYRVLRHNVMMNAVKCAQENGYEAVTCGHTHYAGDMVIDGIRYLNTGAWTEAPAYFLHLTDDQMILNRFEDNPYRVQKMKTFLVN
jgi:UDP-2,3-diacylglucosamine pyrophosphatase LpxH